MFAMKFYENYAIIRMEKWKITISFSTHFFSKSIHTHNCRKHTEVGRTSFVHLNRFNRPSFPSCFNGIWQCSFCSHCHRWRCLLPLFSLEWILFFQCVIIFYSFSFEIMSTVNVQSVWITLWMSVQEMKRKQSEAEKERKKKSPWMKHVIWLQ